MTLSQYTGRRKRLVRDALHEHPVGGGNHPDVDAGLYLIGANTLDFTSLEKPEQQALHARARLPNFVHEHSSAVRLFERPQAIP